MRDDIHKRVPRPPKVQRWVKRALREADRLSGRSRAALEDAVREVCRTAISNGFLRGLRRLMESGQSDLFGALGGISSARDLGGSGNPIERRILGDCQRAAASGPPAADAIVTAIADALKDQSHADIRAAEPVLLPTREREARSAIDQMKADVSALEYRAIAAEHLGLKERDLRSSAPISPDENLLAPTKNGGTR